MNFLKGFIDSLQLKLYLTFNPKPNELSTLELGSDSDPIGIIIPPGMKSFKIKTFCPSECFQNVWLLIQGFKEIFVQIKLFCILLKEVSNSITMIKIMPHTKMLGYQVSTKIIRNKNKTEHLFQNDYYNPNLGNVYDLIPRVNISKVVFFLKKIFFQIILNYVKMHFNI